MAVATEFRGGKQYRTVYRNGMPIATTPVQSGGGSGGGGGARKIAQQMGQQRASANMANEQRYQQLLDQVAQTQERVRGNLAQARTDIEDVGQAGQERIAQQQQQQFADAQQSLISRGLGNTTILESARRGVSADAERAQQRLAEQIAQMRGGQQERAAGMNLNLGQFVGSGIMSRRDEGPNMNLYVKLLQQLGAA